MRLDKGYNVLGDVSVLTQRFGDKTFQLYIQHKPEMSRRTIAEQLLEARKLIRDDIQHEQES